MQGGEECLETGDDGQRCRSGRAMCSGCGRPANACICASLPTTPLPLPEGLESVILLRHPKERRQKHQSAWILERCVAGVRQHVTRRLPQLREEAGGDSSATSAQRAPQGLEQLYERPETCLLVFPGPGARPLKEVLDPGVRHLIFLDATWRYAREMAAPHAGSVASGTHSGCCADPLAAIRRVELTPPPGTRPVFVVRKPMRLGGATASGEASSLPIRSGGGSEGAFAEVPEDEDEERWGFSTGEAVALALDEIAHLRCGGAVGSNAPPKPSERPAWDVVSRALGAYSRIQLEQTVAPKIRTDRPGFIPKLYEAAPVFCSSEGAGCA
ncbi:unnamed protein product, partial [Polarella glacialis]